jgi:hypothetical protein
MTAFFNHAGNPDDGLPYVIWGGETVAKPVPPAGASAWDIELINQLQYIIEHAEWGDWFYPALVPGTVQVTIPSYFGCVEERASKSVKVKPIIGKPSDVYRLPVKGFGPDTAGGGRISMYEPDMQGPFSVASQIWDVERFLIALYDCPDEVNCLLERCTDAVILYAKMAFEAAGGDLIPFHCMPALWMPPEKCLAISEDLVAVVSPRIIDEFVKPCLVKIASAFNGSFVHSCGSVNNIIGTLSNTPGLVGFNFSSVESDLEDVARRAGNGKTYVIHNSPVNRTDLPLLKPEEHAVLCADIFRRYDLNGFCIIIPCLGRLSPDGYAGRFREIFNS